jgi:hypothetical protein
MHFDTEFSVTSKFKLLGIGKKEEEKLLSKGRAAK